MGVRHCRGTDEKLDWSPMMGGRAVGDFEGKDPARGLFSKSYPVVRSLTLDDECSFESCRGIDNRWRVRGGKEVVVYQEFERFYVCPPSNMEARGKRPMVDKKWRGA